MYLQKKTPVLQFGRTLEQNSWIMSHHFLSMDGWPGGAIFFLWGQSVKIIRKYSSKKIQPLAFFLTPAPRPLEVTPLYFLWLVKLNMCVCTLLQGQMYSQQKHVFCNLGARWHKILEFVPSCPISGWLAWWCDFFSCGANLWRSPASIRAKRSSPFDFIFDTCASASWSHCFTLFRLVKLNTCACTLLQGQMYFHQKHVFSRAILARVDTKFLNSSHHVLSLDDWPDDATFFLWCQPLKIIRKYSAKKRSSLLDFIFDTCASASSNHFFGWWSWTRVSVPLCKDKYIFSKKTCVLQFGRALTHFLNLSHHVLSMDDRVMRLFSCGASLWRSSTSRVQPLGFYFWHLRLGLFKSPFFWLKLNMCVCTLLQSHVGNHTPSNNHGTFFPGVWRTYMF